MKKFIIVFLLVGGLAQAQEQPIQVDPVTFEETSWDAWQESIDLQEPSPTQELSQQDKLCLAKNIWHEARNEPYEGKVAVLLVTINRALSGNFPQNVCDVVYQRSVVVKRQYNRAKKSLVDIGRWTVCQFSWTCERLPPPRLNDNKWLDILRIVENYSVGKYEDLEKKYQNVYNYHATYVNPRWNNLREFTRVGQHIFYKPR